MDWKYFTQRNYFENVSMNFTVETFKYTNANCCLEFPHALRLQDFYLYKKAKLSFAQLHLHCFEDINPMV